jgi:hypothetical protein
MEPKAYFLKPVSVPQRQYEALRAYFVEERTAAQAAQQFGYTLSAFYSLVRDFKSNLTDQESEPFFATKQAGRPGRALIKTTLHFSCRRPFTNSHFYK